MRVQGLIFLRHADDHFQADLPDITTLPDAVIP